MTELAVLLERAVSQVRRWETEWGPYQRHPSTLISTDRIAAALAEYGDRLKDNYPFFHPRYAGQMLKPPHPAAIAAYTAAMCINPNNHALDGGPATAKMEREVVDMLGGMFGFEGEVLGHLTSSGTIANLEALWVARCLHPEKAVAYGSDAHYTHGRMCSVLGIKTRVVPSDRAGRMDLAALGRALEDGSIGTVVATAGTTGMGAVDAVGEILDMAASHGARVHVDAAYGGFFALLKDAEVLAPTVASAFRSIARADSVVVDPHKHGLQPYGCGAVLFADPTVGRFYQHDSPYTYFTSDDLHLGEISLECSRAGAAAGALWMTLRLLPLTADGLGGVLGAGVRAARDWHARIADSDLLVSQGEPELDIISFFPNVATSAVAISRASRVVFEACMADPEDPVFLSVQKIPVGRVFVDGRPIRRDRPDVEVLRSVLMKPEHEQYVGHLHAAVERAVAAL